MKEKTTYKMNCKWLIIKWAQLGSNLDPLLRKAPVELFKRSLDCGGGSRPVGATEAMVDLGIYAYTLLMQKSLQRCGTLKASVGPAGLEPATP